MGGNAICSCHRGRRGRPTLIKEPKGECKAPSEVCKGWEGNFKEPAIGGAGKTQGVALCPRVLTNTPRRRRAWNPGEARVQILPWVEVKRAVRLGGKLELPGWRWR